MPIETFHDFQVAVKAVADQLAGATSLLVGITGPTASGKSTFARQLCQALIKKKTKACVFEGDRFVRPHLRRTKDAGFPDGIYETDRLRAAVQALSHRRPFVAPFYDKDGFATGRITVALGAKALPSVIVNDCRPKMVSPENELTIDAETGDVLEQIVPGDEIWIFDSELSLFYDELRPLYNKTIGLRASRDVRRQNFLGAISRGERYPLLTPTEAIAKIEGFWRRDDEMISETVDLADVLVILE